jgi:uncharacterized protein YjbI with pentapeptide repeats
MYTITTEEKEELFYQLGKEIFNADLIGVYLKDANLEGANLEGANLKHADLKNICLTKANLAGADLG